MTENADFAERNSDSDQLEQLQPSDTLVDRGVADVLDEGYTAPEKWSPAQGFGNTAAEMRQGETVEQRVAQEEPETERDDSPWNPDGEPREVGSVRAGRLVDANGGIPGVDHEAESVAISVGIDGGAASAEEAAMHVIEDTDDEEQ
jgi:hypothetical protein